MECALKKIKANEGQTKTIKFKLPGDIFKSKTKFEITPTLVNECESHKKQTLEKRSYNLEFKSTIEVNVPAPSDKRYDVKSFIFRSLLHFFCLPGLMIVHLLLKAIFSN